jgi:hypothetical protein
MEGGDAGSAAGSVARGDARSAVGSVARGDESKQALHGAAKQGSGYHCSMFYMGVYLAELEVRDDCLQSPLLCCQVPEALLSNLQVSCGAHLLRSQELELVVRFVQLLPGNVTTMVGNYALWALSHQVVPAALTSVHWTSLAGTTTKSVE